MQLSLGNYLGSQRGLPYPTKDLQVIVYTQTYEDGGTTYLRTSDGSMFEITNADEIINGVIPFKSNITIKAPSGITDVINGFWYTGEVSNELHPISFFNDIDYEHKIFVRTVNQILDTNGKEIRPAGIIGIYIYSTALSGNDLIKMNNYCNVPNEQLVNVQWVSKDGNDNTGDGSKINPYLTIKKAIDEASSSDRIYVKSGNYIEARTFDFLWINKDVDIYGTGFIKLESTNSSDYIVQTTSAAIGYIRGIQFVHDSENYLISANSSVKIERCYIEDGDVASITSTPSGVSPTFTNTVISSATKPISTSIYGAYFISCLFISNTTLSNITISDGNGTEFTYCKFITNNTGLIFNHYVAAELKVENCLFDINNSLGGIYLGSSSLATELSFNYNIIDSSQNITTSLIKSSSIVQFNRNNINLTYAFTDRDVVTMLNSTSLEANYNIINTTTTGNVRSFSITQSTGSPSTTSVNIQYNRITSKSEASYIIRIGLESPTIFDDTISGINIIGNYIKYTGSTEASTLHAIFVGHQINANIQYNYVIDFEYHTVYKHSGGVITLGSVSYNLSENSEILCSGLENIKCYGNTIYLDRSENTTGIVISDNAGGNPTNADVKNNIVIAKDTDAVYGLESTVSGVAMDIDNNILYAEDGVELFLIDGTFKTKVQWLAAGFDANSKFTDPLLNSDLIPQTGSVAIGNGEDLGETYKTGLDISTNWGDSETVPTVVTKDQSGSWDIGAYVS